MHKPISAPRMGRLSDVEIARQWIDSITGELYFCQSHDAPGKGEFYRYANEAKGVNRSRIVYLREIETEARVLDFLLELVENGAHIRISPTKVRNVRMLAAWLMLKEGH